MDQQKDSTISREEASRLSEPLTIDGWIALWEDRLRDYDQKKAEAESRLVGLRKLKAIGVGDKHGT